MTVSISHRGELLLNEVYGYADLEALIEMTPDHLFRIASHSKTFTATAIMQLKEAGLLQLDDKISDHLEWFSSKSDPRVKNITVREFLNHTSGLIRDGVDADYWILGREFPETGELIEFVQDSKLQTLDSNQIFKYSNFAYSYLGSLIETVSGTPYNQYVNEKIIEPLRLKSTYPELTDQNRVRLASGHSRLLFNSGRRIFDHADTHGMSAATGFCSTGVDLCNYFLAHCYGNKTILSDESKREMQHGYWKAGSDKTERYGLGLLEYTHEEVRYFGHGGGFPGFKTFSLFDPKNQLVVTVLTNSIDGPASNIAKQIIHIISFFQTNHGDTKDCGRFTGRFISPWNVIDVINVNGELFASEPSDWGGLTPTTMEKLTKIDDTTLQIEEKPGTGSPGEQVEYKFNPDKETQSIRYAGVTMQTEQNYLNEP